MSVYYLFTQLKTENGIFSYSNYLMPISQPSCLIVKYRAYGHPDDEGQKGPMPGSWQSNAPSRDFLSLKVLKVSQRQMVLSIHLHAIP